MRFNVRSVHRIVQAFIRRRRSRASPVLTAISLVNGKPWEPVNFDPRKIGIPQPISKKFVTGD